METEGSLPHSQVPTTSPYPEPDESSPCRHIPLPEDPTSHYPPIYAWVFQAVCFLQDSWPKPCIHLSSPQTCYVPHLSHSSRFDHQNSTGCGVQIIKLFSVFFSFPLLPRPSQAQIFSTPYSQTPSANVPPSMWATKFHPHTKQAKL